MKRAKAEAARLTAEYRTRDPFAICDGLGIYVVTCPLPAHIRGFYQNHAGCQLIYLNESLGQRDRQAVCAHELGHAVLHEDHNFLFMTQNCQYIMSRFEKEADLFAAELLIDPAELWEPAVQTVARQWGLSEESVRQKFGL